MTLLKEPLKKSPQGSKAGKKSKVIWTVAELRAWRLPKKISVSKWADENRILDSKTSAEPGHWRTDRTPYLKGIMDAFNDPVIEEITIKASTQVGKTESFLNMLAYCIDQDPGPALVVMPRKDDAKMMSVDRIRSMIDLSPALSRHFTGYDDDIQNYVVNLDRMILYLAWANSPAALASKPIRYLFFDETNKYPPFSGKEADPIKLATERTRTFWNRKVVKVSTPTVEDGYISREYERSDKCKYYVPCPHCGKYQVLIWGQVRFPKEERNPEIIKAQRLAYYECVSCKEVITDLEKQQMLLKGVWVPEGCYVDKKGNIKGKRKQTTHKGFWINALYSPWLTFSEIVAEWISSQGRIELLMNFLNSWLAEEWIEKIEERKPDKIRKLALEYPAGIVPEGVCVLTAGIDVQTDHLYYVIRGWGIGYESWLIEADRAESWEEVYIKVIDRYFESEVEGIPPFQVILACIDTGHKTTEVYDICREWTGVARAIKGQQDLRGLVYKTTHIDKYPDGKIMPEGLCLYHIDTTLFKDKVARLMNTESEAPSKWHLHINPSDIYLKQLCSEGKILERSKKYGKKREVWKLLSSHAENHFWDCEIYATAAAEMLQVYALREEDEPRPVTNVELSQSDRRNNWIGKKGRWLNRG